MKRLVLPFLLLLLNSSMLLAEDDASEKSGGASTEEGTSLTIYSSADPASFDPQRFIAQQVQGYNTNYVWQVPGFGVVKEVRQVKFKDGLNELHFTDVAQFIDPTTVSFADILHPQNTVVLEQNFEFDLVNAEKLLHRYVDHEVTVDVPRGESVETVTGTLLSSVQNQLVLKTAEGVRVLPSHGQIRLAGQGSDLITRPTLVWKVKTDTAGERTVRTTYQTDGITWRSDYNMVLSAKEDSADVGAWVSIMNLTGTAFSDTKLKLIAGDVQRIQPQAQQLSRAKGAAAELMMADAAGFEEKSFFEYHLYTLPRKTDIKSNATQQLMLFPTARDAKVEKLLVYYGAQGYGDWMSDSPSLDRSFGNTSNKKVDVYVRTKNTKENNLGMPLPAGKVRVYKKDDADGTLEFVGEDLIDHTARDEQILIRLGQSFDVVGERTQTDFNLDIKAKVMTESFKIELRNHKDAPQKVLVKENLYRWSTWTITQESDKHEKADSRTAHFEVTVPPNGEKTVTYTVKYTW